MFLILRTERTAAIISGVAGRGGGVGVAADGEAEVDVEDDGFDLVFRGFCSRDEEADEDLAIFMAAERRSCLSGIGYIRRDFSSRRVALLTSPDVSALDARSRQRSASSRLLSMLKMAIKTKNVGSRTRASRNAKGVGRERSKKGC